MTISHHVMAFATLALLLGACEGVEDETSDELEYRGTRGDLSLDTPAPYAPEDVLTFSFTSSRSDAKVWIVCDNAHVAVADGYASALETFVSPVNFTLPSAATLPPPYECTTLLYYKRQNGSAVTLDSVTFSVD